MLGIGAFANHDAFADPAAIMRELRSSVCKPASSRPAPLHSNRSLNEAAQRIADGTFLQDALDAQHYRARASRALTASGVANDGALRAIALRQFCSEIATQSLTDMGTVRRADRVWIILAEPFSAPALSDASAVADEVLELVNSARQMPRNCGAQFFNATSALRLSRVLTIAATQHGADLDRHKRLSHTGTDGSTPGSRATRAGYEWQLIGENVASGPETPQQVVSGWLASPEHCANLMDKRFTDMGLAYRVDWRAEAGVYWVQDFGQPRGR